MSDPTPPPSAKVRVGCAVAFSCLLCVCFFFSYLASCCLLGVVDPAAGRHAVLDTRAAKGGGGGRRRRRIMDNNEFLQLKPYKTRPLPPIYVQFAIRPVRPNVWNGGPDAPIRRAHKKKQKKKKKKQRKKTIVIWDGCDLTILLLFPGFFQTGERQKQRRINPSISVRAQT
jgi:hypothetical protein